MEQGDFSALGGYNVTSNTCVPNNGVAICLKDPTNGGATIPAIRFRRVSWAVPMAWLRKSWKPISVAPNVTGTQNGTLNNLNSSYPTDVSITQSLDRVDENIGQHVRLFGRLHWQNLSIVGGTLLPSGSSFGPTNSRNYAFGYTHVISSSLVNDFHFGVNKLISNNLNYWAAKQPEECRNQPGHSRFQLRYGL